MKFLLSVLVLTASLVACAQGCTVSTFWQGVDQLIINQRVVNCTEWSSIFETSGVSSGALNIRLSEIGSFEASIVLATIGTKPITDYTFEDAVCPQAANSGEDLVCTLEDSTGDVVVETSLYLPTDDDLTSGAPTSTSQTVTLTLASQYDVLPLAITFGGVAISNDQAGIGCTLDGRNLVCGYDCNPQLIEFIFDSTWSKLSGGSNSAIIVSANAVQTITFLNSGGETVVYKFTIRTFQPQPDDCENPPTPGDSSPGSLFQASSFLAFIMALLIAF